MRAMNERTRRLLAMLLTGEIAGVSLFCLGASLDAQTRMRIASSACEFMRASWHSTAANGGATTARSEVRGEIYVVVSGHDGPRSGRPLDILCGSIASDAGIARDPA
jgi:hypothetical protein